MKKKFVAVAFSILLVAFFCFIFVPTTVFANSAQLSYIDDPYGDLIAEADTDISVEHELLTFDFGITSDDGDYYYTPIAKVSAVYTMQSPAAQTVKMGFPLDFGGLPSNETFVPSLSCNNAEVVPDVYIIEHDWQFVTGRRDFETMTFEQILAHTKKNKYEAKNIPDLAASMFLLVYEVDLNAGQNTMMVSYCMGGSYDATVAPPIFTYRYFTNPAKNWASFGTLEIKIVTNEQTRFLLEGSVSFSETTEGVYVYSGSLPNENISVSLCASLTQERVPNNGWLYVVFFLVVPTVFAVAVIAVVAVVIVKSTRRHR